MLAFERDVRSTTVAMRKRRSSVGTSVTRSGGGVGLVSSSSICATAEPALAFLVGISGLPLYHCDAVIRDALELRKMAKLPFFLWRFS